MKALAAAIVIAWAFLIMGTSALAHSVLVASSPAAGAQIQTPPQTVVLTFDEGVESELGSVRVLDASGSVRSSGPVFHPDGDARRVAVRVDTGARGRYVVAWHVISADSHLVGGAFAFGVGVPAGAAPVVAADNGAVTLLPIVHFALLAAIVLGIGLPLGALVLRARTSAYPIEFGAWFVAAFAAFGDVAFRADLAGGSLWPAFTTHVGTSRALTIGAAFVAILALTGLRRRLAILAPACAVAIVSLSLAGHAADGAFAWAGIAADALHLLAAATWIGVLAIGTTVVAGPRLRSISPIATGAVIVLIVTGIVQTLRNAGSFGALLTTPYGKTIDVKIALLVLLLAFAFSARRALARGAFAIGTRIKIELWLLTAVLAATAILVESPLPREASASGLASATATATATATFSVRGVDVTVTAVARDAQMWTIRIDGSAPLDGAQVSVREAERNVGPLDVALTRASDRSFTGTIALPFAGNWSALVSARSGDFDETHYTVPLRENRS